MTGEGGMITTNDDEVANKCRLLRNHGMSRRYYHDEVGFNLRMTDIQSAIGLVQLNRISEIMTKRNRNAAYYNANIRTVITPCPQPGYEHAWHQYTVRVNGDRVRDDAMKQLHDAGIGTGVYYPVPAHKQAYLKTIVGELTFPVAERMAEEVLSLPVHPQLSQEELEKIVTEVNKL